MRFVVSASHLRLLALTSALSTCATATPLQQHHSSSPQQGHPNGGDRAVPAPLLPNTTPITLKLQPRRQTLQSLSNVETTTTTTALTSRSQSKTCVPSPDTCDFYPCLNDHYHCGSTGYPLAYGQRYCIAFQRFSPRFSVAGQAWIHDVRLCLQETLVPYVDGSLPANETCDNIKKVAFASHSGCYVQEGLCQLPVTDWFEIQRVVGFRGLFGSEEAIEAAFRAAVGCAKFWGWLLKEVLTNGGNGGHENAIEGGAQLG